MPPLRDAVRLIHRDHRHADTLEKSDHAMPREAFGRQIEHIKRPVLCLGHGQRVLFRCVSR